MSKQDKKIRNVAKDLYKCITDDIINPRLDKIETYVKESMARMTAQNNRIQGFLLGEVKFTIANELDDAKVTREALLEILNEKLGVEGLTALINERKPIVKARLIKEAEERMAAEQEAARLAAEQENKGPGAENMTSDETPVTPSEGADNGQN
jgi:hypothetical protein